MLYLDRLCGVDIDSRVLITVPFKSLSPSRDTFTYLESTLLVVLITDAIT